MLTDPYILGWVVGILEGEGSFMAHHSTNHKKRGSEKRYLRIDLTSTDEWTVRTFHDIVGFGGTHLQPSRGESRKPCWHWKGMGENAEALMRQILPLMSPRRREKIESLLSTHGSASSSARPSNSA